MPPIASFLHTELVKINTEPTRQLMEYGPLLCPLYQPTLCSRPVHSSLLVRVEGVTAAYFPVCFPDAQSHALMLKRHKFSYEAGHGFPSGAWRGMSGWQAGRHGHRVQWCNCTLSLSPLGMRSQHCLNMSVFFFKRIPGSWNGMWCSFSEITLCKQDLIPLLMPCFNFSKWGCAQGTGKQHIRSGDNVVTPLQRRLKSPCTCCRPLDNLVFGEKQFEFSPGSDMSRVVQRLIWRQEKK